MVDNGDECESVAKEFQKGDCFDGGLECVKLAMWRCCASWWSWCCVQFRWAGDPIPYDERPDLFELAVLGTSRSRVFDCNSVPRSFPGRF